MISVGRERWRARNVRMEKKWLLKKEKKGKTSKDRSGNRKEKGSETHPQ